MTLRTELRQSGAALSTPAFWDDTLTTTAATFPHTLSGAQTDAITSYPDLSLRFTATQAAPAMPAWQATGTAVPWTGTAATAVAWPAHAVDDIALLFVETAGGQATTLGTANGFVEVTGSPQATGTGTAGTRLAVYWCRATSTSMASPTVVVTTGDHGYGLIITFRGCITTGNPWDGTPVGGVKAAASTSATVTGLTTTVANTLLVQALTKDLDTAAAFASAQTNGNLSSITERTDAGTNVGGGGGIAVWHGGKATAGATGNTTVTVTSSINAFHTIALRPPAGSRARVTWARLVVPTAGSGGFDPTTLPFLQSPPDAPETTQLLTY